ncbi:hypothetical protein KSS87_000816 [Heliosperma pusillum]|nr:hypothetical protein KSS87_000816 [Heliosperma pusillum]
MQTMGNVKEGITSKDLNMYYHNGNNGRSSLYTQ